MFVALLVADRIAARWPGPAAAPITPWRSGVTVIIPERDAPELLAEALASLRDTLAGVHEAHQVIVVANGALPARYASLALDHPDVEWIYSEPPLGFAGAVERGLAHARHDGTFLLNNDMRIAPDALARLLALRAPEVFCVAAQIFQRSESGRREETGLVDWYVDRAGVHLFHAQVPPGDEPRVHLCGSGGATLFRTQALRRYLRDSRCYDPFYWEDAEWGVRAWRDGLRCLFCPAAHAHHRHRATTARFYPAPELERVVERNRWLFDARHGITRDGAHWLMERLCELPYQSQRELARVGQAAGVLVQRVRARRPPQPTAPPSLVGTGAAVVPSGYGQALRARSPARRCIVLATPFAVYPPRHGGARRVAALIRELSAGFDIVLVSDEAALYDARSFAHFGALHAVHLVDRPAEAKPAVAASLRERMRTHCHPALVAAITQAIARYRPDIVQVEYAELAPLIDLVASGSAPPRWVLALHDAYGADDFADAADGEAYAATLRAYDGVTVCSAEDAALLCHPRVVCVPNGCEIAPQPYLPSSASELLFIGPFRYAPNRDGIVTFLRDAWPAIRAAIPQASLHILGGDEYALAVATERAFAQPGVTVSGHRDDVPALLARCALTINPLAAIRGSAIKLVESLAAGRMCVSTAAGARGFRDMGLPGLVVADDIGGMIAPVVRLLAHPEERHRREDPRVISWDRHRWSHAAKRQQALYDDLLRVHRA